MSAITFAHHPLECRKIEVGWGKSDVSISESTFSEIKSVAATCEAQKASPFRVQQ
jgi:hypothetical protein